MEKSSGQRAEGSGVAEVEVGVCFCYCYAGVSASGGTAGGPDGVVGLADTY